MDGACGALLALLMMAIAIIDSRRYIIPNELVATTAVLGLLRAGLIGPDAGLSAILWAACSGAATAIPFLLLMILYRQWRKREGLGLGDVKLAAVAGTWLGVITIFAVIELATLSALAAYFIAGLMRRRPMRVTAFLPFGLFLAPAIWIGWLAETLLG